MSGHDLQARLRAAYEARARLVDVDASSPVPDFASLTDAQDAAAHRPQQSGGPWRTLLLAAAAVIVVAVTSTAVVLVAHRHFTQPGGPTPTTSRRSSLTPTVTKSAQPMLGLGQSGTRAQVPWTLVGQGWTVALWSTSSSQPKSQTVVLVDPLGGRYTITSITTDMYLVDVSGDHTRALLIQARTSSTSISQLDLRTGTISRITDAQPGAVAEYTKPNGEAIIVAHVAVPGDGTGSVLDRIGLDGQLQHRYGVRSINDLAVPLYSPDGSTLVVMGLPAMAVMNNDGSGGRQLATPPGATICRPLRWWQPGVVLTNCYTPGMQLWLTPVNGRAPTPLTQPANTTNGAYVPVPTDAWLFGNQIIAADAPPCGEGSTLVTVSPAGTAQDISISAPPGIGTSLAVSGVTADAIYGRVDTTCSHNTTGALVQFSPARKTMTVLLGQNIGGGTVYAAITIGIDT